MIRPAVSLAICLLAACQSASLHRHQPADADTATSAAAGIQPQEAHNATIEKADTASHVWLLVPGKSAGAVQLGETADRLQQQLGDADVGDAAMQKAVGVWYSHHDTTAHSVGVYTSLDAGNDTEQCVRQIRVNSPSFHTREGVGPSSSLGTIRLHYSLQKTDSYRDRQKRYTVYTSPAGISFEVNDGGRCVAVIIHAAGLNELGTYLQLRTTNAYIDGK